MERRRVVACSRSDVLNLVGSALHPHHDVFHASSVDAAMVLMAQIEPWTLVVDVRPDFDGGGGLRRLPWLRRAAGRAMLVVAAASPTDDDVRRYVEAGAFDCLRLDWAPDRLRARVRRLMTVAFEDFAVARATPMEPRRGRCPPP